MEMKKALWSGRFEGSPEDLMKKYGESLSVDWSLYEEDLCGTGAHGKMLHKIGILSEEELDCILKALDQIKEEIETGKFLPQESLEDVHMNIEQRLIDIAGDVGAKIHTGRSRNDQVLTDIKLYLKKEVKLIMESWKALLRMLLFKAEEDLHVIIPGFTHLMHAQPINAGHYWMAYFWKFLRDLKRLENAYEAMDLNPLGVGALAGSTLPLDREYTCELLGFSRNTENSLDTVSDRDFILDLHYAFATFGIHGSGMAEDLIIWNTQEFGFVKLPDGYCTGSSMMPNKKNPDALELTRGKTGGLVSGLFGLMMNLKGLPLGYNRDLQEDKKAIMENLGTMKMIPEILIGVLEGLEFQEKNINKHLNRGYLMATDLAEYLVMKGVPFRNTHHIVGGLVKYGEEKGKDFKDFSLAEFKKFHEAFDQDVFSILSFESGVNRRNTLGGTSKEQVVLQIKEGKRRLEELLV